MKKTTTLFLLLFILIFNNRVIAQVGINMGNKPIEAMLQINGKLRVQNLEKDYSKDDLEQMLYDESSKELIPAQKNYTQFIYPKIFITNTGERSEEITYNATSYTITDGHLFISNINIIPFTGFGNGGAVNFNPNDWTGIRNITIHGQDEHNPTWNENNIATFFAEAIRPAPSTRSNWTLVGRVSSGHEHVIAKGTLDPHEYTYSNSANWEFDVIGISRDFVYIKNWYSTGYNSQSPTNQQIPYEITANADGTASLPENPLKDFPY